MSMQSIFCPRCRLEQPSDHLYCLACGTSLPSHLLGRRPAKRVRYFAGIRVTDEDPKGAFLRVSCYLREQTFETEDGSVTIPGHHVRFSVWVGSEARCVMSIPATEARDLARFIDTELGRLEEDLVGEGS
ncbi:MAG: hypothetical protein ACRDJ5_09570 [Actinomycetota bacterium]